MKHTIITIDGPSGTGKSTIAKTIAAELGFFYLDTGSLYRAASLAIEKAKGNVNDPDQCVKILSKTSIELKNEAVFVNGKDVSKAIRSHHVSDISSKIAVHKQVREQLVKIQRSVSDSRPVVVEGRDTGSVVFPAADIKIYLDASTEERAVRRHKELISKGTKIDLAQVKKDIKERDQRDLTRSHSPLVVPQGASVVNTTHLSIEEVVSLILRIIKEILPAKRRKGSR